MNNNWKEQFKNWYISTSGQNYMAYSVIADYIESNIIQSPEAARHHLSPVWVKASERLPGTSNDVVIKCIDLVNESYYQVGSAGKIKALLNHEFDLHVQWLDENNLEHPSSLTDKS